MTSNKYKGKYQSIGGNVNISRQQKNAGAQYSFWAGIGMILFILLWSIIVPCPSNSQLGIFRIILPLALASLAASLPQFFRVSLSGIVKFGAGLGVFMVVYFFNPAPMVIKDTCDEDQYLKGKVLYAGTPLRGAEVNVTALNKTDFTDGNGCFNLAYRGDLKAPLIIQLRYKSIDTLVAVQEYGDKEVIQIHIKDTIPTFSLSIASGLVEEYLERQQKKLETMHLGFLLKHGGKKKAFKDLCRVYKYHEELCDSERNEVFFENGFDQLSTQKALVQARIPIKPLNPYGAYYLNNYEAYLYQLDSSRTNTKRFCNIHFALLNLDKTRYQVEDIDKLADNQWLMKVSFRDNIRFVRTLAHFNSEQSKKVIPEYADSGKELKSIHSGARYRKVSGGRKEQATYYVGVRPFEEFVAIYANGRWQIAGTR